MSKEQEFLEEVRRVRQQSPRIHCLTNPVTMQDVANLLLTAGGSAIMAQDSHEVVEIVNQCQGLLLNTGVPDTEKVKAWVLAGKKANQMKIPVVLDPVGVGASSFRRESVGQLLNQVKMTVIRCNQGEAAALLSQADKTEKAAGVESSIWLSGDSQRDLAQALAQRYQCTVLVSGETDLVSDGERWQRIEGGDRRAARITGCGCMLSALCALFCGAGISSYSAALGASKLWKECARLAGLWAGPETMRLGSFHTGLFDALGQLCWEK